MITQNDIDIFWKDFERDKVLAALQTNQNKDFPLPWEQEAALPVGSTRSSILTEALKTVTGQRQVDYGTVEDNFQNIANLWNSYFMNSSKGIPNIKSTDVASMMALMKIARLIHSPGHRDSWVDLAGYAACGAECGLKGASSGSGDTR